MNERRKQCRHFYEPRDRYELTFSCNRRKPLPTNDEWSTLLCQAVDRAILILTSSRDWKKQSPKKLVAQGCHHWHPTRVTIFEAPIELESTDQVAVQGRFSEDQRSGQSPSQGPSALGTGPTSCTS
jgi:hypothetical protein